MLKREIEICQRVREARRGTSLSQIAFARLIGTDSSRLASHEHARVPIKAHLALAVAKVSGVSLKWLAEGTEPKKMSTWVDKKLRERIPENQLFSETYDVILRPLIEEEIEQSKKFHVDNSEANSISETGQFSHIGDVGSEDITNAVGRQVSNIIEEIPPHLFQEFYSRLCEAIRCFISDNADAIEVFSKSVPPGLAKNDLTNKADSLTNDVVKPVLPKLIERLNRATKERGSKSELAAWLGVHRQSVTDWLSGKQEPGGEITLRLLKWVEQQERQK